MHWVLLLFWMFLIFYLSSIPNLSSGLKEDFVLRKFAHIFEFFVLASLFFNAFLKTKITSIKELKKGKKAGWSAFLTFIYAGSDEFHQSFVFGRHGSFVDWLFWDFLGIVIFLCVYFYFFSRAKQN